MFPGPLRAFSEAARSGSVRKAGESLGLAPSSISRQILILERQVGTALFERNATGVSLTHAGKRFAEFARTVLLDYDSLRADFNDLRGVEKGLIRFATVEGMVSESAVAAITLFQKKYPDVLFQLNVWPAPRVIGAVKAGEADIGLTFCGQPDADLTVVRRIRDPIVLVVAPDHKWAGRSSISLEDLQHIKLAAPDENFHIRRILDRASHALGFVLQPVLSTDAFTALTAFVRARAGAAVLTRLSVKADETLGLVKSIPIDAPEFRDTTIDVIILKGRRLSALLNRFLDVLAKVPGEAAPPRGLRRAR